MRNLEKQPNLNPINLLSGMMSGNVKTSFSQYVMEGFQVEEWSIKFKFQLKQHNFIRSQEMEHLLNCIKEPTVCHKCFEEFKKDPSISPSLRDYTLLDVGFTDIGIQVWCRRHERNVCHVNFDGNQLESDFRCIEPFWIRIESNSY